MSGAIVTEPHGWKRGKPVYSSEGCYYPTWVREKPKAKAKKKRAKKR